MRKARKKDGLFWIVLGSVLSGPFVVAFAVVMFALMFVVCLAALPVFAVAWLIDTLTGARKERRLMLKARLAGTKEDEK